MTVNHVSFTVYLAATLLWLFEPFDPKGLAQTCVSSKAPRSEVISACTNLIEAGDVTPDYQHLFLTKRAWAHRCDGHYELAIADVDRALEMQPDNYKTWILRARIHEANNGHELALADYDKAVEIGSEVSFTHWIRARYLDRNGKDDQAFDDYERVLELNPNASNAASYVSNHLFNEERYDDALDFVVDATQRWPDQRWVYDDRIQLDIVYSKNVETALAAAEKAVSLSDMDVAKYLYPAAVHLTIGDEQKGIALVEEYSKWYMEYRVPKRTIWDRITGNTNGNSDRLAGEEFLRRGMFFAMFVRGDLARPELLRFLDVSGSDGLRVLLAMARDDGTQISEENEANAEHIVDAYIERHYERAPKWAVRYKGYAGKQ